MHPGNLKAQGSSPISHPSFPCVGGRGPHVAFSPLSPDRKRREPLALKLAWHRPKLLGLWVLIGILAAAPLQAAMPLTIIHSSDLHSHLLGFAPEIDATPLNPDHDATRGGMARIAGIIKETKAARGDQPVLVLDAGDFLMGTLFHLISREEAFELRIMKEAGYDAVGLGNHEFDLKPDGLARILRAGTEKGMPYLVCANIEFDSADKADDSLSKAFQDDLVTPTVVIERGGVKVGIFGLVGKNAAEVTPFAKPVRFGDPIQSARRMVDKLRREDRVDVVVCLSHGGLKGPTLTEGEDVELARQVPGIDVIVSGHTHVLRPAPLVERGTIIVQAGAYGTHLGVLDLEVQPGKVVLKDYALRAVDDTVAGDSRIQGMVEQGRELVNRQVLADKGLSFFKVIAHSSFDLTCTEGDSNLGNIIADAIRWSIDKAEQGRTSRKTDVAFESNGVIRDDVLMGATGNLTVSDCFRALPLGVGMREDTLGYPLVAVYLYGHEIKKALEVLTSVYPLKGSDYYLQVSGLKFRYHPRRVIFDRVIDIQIGDDDKGYAPLDVSEGNRRLYKVGGNIYNTTFLKLIGGFTYGILTIVPKDARGLPIQDMRDAIVDADADRPGLQELKQWQGFLAYLHSFKDIDGDGIGDVPLIYQYPQGRIVRVSSWNPALFYKNATGPTWLVTSVGAFLLAGLCILAL